MPHDSPECPDCLDRSGLCRSCQRQILPQLRVNVAWLKLMGEAMIEQKSRQSTRAASVSEQQRAYNTRRDAARKAKRTSARSARRRSTICSAVAA